MKKSLDKISFAIFATIMSIFFLFSSCGYHLGSIMHPQIKSIAIAPVKNDTTEPDVSAWLRQSFAEQFEFDASLKVKSIENADCILYAKVNEVKTTATSFSSYDGDQTFSPAEFSVSVKVEYTVIIPGRTSPLIETREVVGEARYQVAADHNIARRRGVQQACREAAKKAVIYVVEAW